MGLGTRTQVPGSGKNSYQILDPGVKKTQDPFWVDLQH
jgi:hypothetical protein